MQLRNTFRNFIKGGRRDDIFLVVNLIINEHVIVNATNSRALFNTDPFYDNMFEIGIPVLILLSFVPASMLEDDRDTTEVIVEILVILEKNFSDSFESPNHIKIHFCKLFEEVNEIYQTINGIQINISLTGLKMINKLEDQPFLEKYIVKYPDQIYINNSCIFEFNHFAIRQTWIKEYDAVLLLTKQVLSSISPSFNCFFNILCSDSDVFSIFSVKMIEGERENYGTAFQEGVCKYTRNTGIAFYEPRVIAHEIAHMLGVEHDSYYSGDKTNPLYEFCAEEHSYIMGKYRPSNWKKELRFSKCSAGVFRMNMKKGKGFDCLWKKNARDTARCKPPKIACTMQTLQGSRSGCTNIDGIIKQIS
uniref:Putative metalloproteinase n=1 Tax=Megacormus gertschi TaxID=1843536 RepID=A0A224XGJ8_9SCOR